MNWRNKLFCAYLSSRVKSIEKWAQNPHATQEEELQKLLKKAKRTSFGKEHNFSEISNPNSFRTTVPLCTYDTLKPYIEKSIKGESNVLWPGITNWYAKSSGTTSDKSKFIPITKDCLSKGHYAGAQDLMGLYCQKNQNTKVYEGRGIVLGGSHSISPLNNRAKYGDLSAVLLQNSPAIGQIARTPGISILLMDEWEEKLRQMVKATIQRKVTHIAGVPTWTLVFLRKVLEETKASSIYEVWPYMELYIHGGVSFTPYISQFNQLFNSEFRYRQTYNASEGFFGIQDQNESDDMLLMLQHGVFYEFIPLGELDNTNPTTLMLDEVELGEIYALVISTNAGLWRYQIGDTIQFTNISPYRIQITGRTKHFINAFGEELMVDQADRALNFACQKTGVKLREYTAAPIYFKEGQNGAHEWLIEFEQNPQNLNDFSDYLDACLKEQNSDYEAKRYKDIALRKPQITVIPKGTFDRWLQLKGKLGGQNKIPRLSNDRSFLEEISKLIKA